MPVSTSLVRRLPKADLHSHIDGSLTPRELFAIARRHRRRITTSSGVVLQTPTELADHVRGGGYEALLENIVERFHPIVGLMQTEEVLRDVGVAYVRGLRRHNVIYAEGRFAPQYHTREGLSYPEAIAAFSEGLEEGSEKYGVTAKLIVAIGREASPKTGNNVCRAAVRDRRVVALDLGGPEQGNPPERFREAFQIATEAGLNKTVHAGEGAGSDSQNFSNIRTAIEVLGAQRVGHAIGIARRPDLVRLAIERKVDLEMNPISNLVLRKIRDIRELGINRLLHSGLVISVNSDDPGLWTGGSMDEVLTAVCRSYDFGLEELDKLITNSFSSSFASAKEKGALLDEYSRARTRLG